MFGHFARARALVFALLLSLAIAVPLLAHAQPAAAYRGQVQNTWYFGIGYYNEGCYYKIWVDTFKTVRMYCGMRDSNGSVIFATDYRSYFCPNGGGCYFEGYIGGWGGGWMAYNVVMVADDDYGGQHGWITNAFPR